MGVSTGVQIEAVSRVTGKAEAFFERKFPGAIHKLMMDSGTRAV